MLRRCLFTACLLGALVWAAPQAWSASGFGKLKGIVVDPSGTPEMGATVRLDPETVDLGREDVHLLSDQNGVFSTPRLRPGLYSVHVTLAGFLPAVEQHVRVKANRTTLVHIGLESIFTSVDELRHIPPVPTENGDWKWVLRSSMSTRSILQWLNGNVQVASASRDTRAPREPRTRVELTNGARRPGSTSGLPGPPATAVSYDQQLGSAGRLLLAGQMIYDPTAGAGLAFSSIWLPSAAFGGGPETTVVMRQERSGPQGHTVRQLRVDQSDQMMLGDRVLLNYGAEFLMAGADSMTTSLRPHARVTVRLARRWTAAADLETDPDAYALSIRPQVLQSALDAMDTLPVLIWNNGRPAMQGDWHEEFSVRHEVAPNASVEVAAFHDSMTHQAVFGFDPTASGGTEFNGCPGPCAFDAGPGRSWGARVTYRQKVANNLEIAATYAWAGALALVDSSAAGPDLQEMLRMRYRHSLAARVSGKLPRLGTRFAASYKWLNGPVVGRQDLFGEAAMGVDPNLSVVIRQPLPCFRSGAHWEALADFRNLLAQGYVPVNGPEGKMVLVPVLRSFRGGVSFQF